MSSSSNEQQQGGLGKLILQQKKPFYQFTNQLVNSQFNNKIYYALIIIEHLQILGFQCYTVYHHRGWAVNWFTSLVNLLNPQFYIRNYDLINYYVPISFVITFVHIGLFVHVYYQHKQNGAKKDIVQPKTNTLITLLHYFNVLVCTIYTIPTLLTSLLTFYCHPSSPYHINRQCYDTYHLFLVFMSLINTVWILIINVYYFLLYYTQNPFKAQKILALSSGLWNLLKFTIKFAPIAYLIFDQKLDYHILYVFGICAGLIGYTGISRVIYPYTRYNKNIQKVMIFIQIGSISSSISFILQAFFTDSYGVDVTFIVSFIITAPLAKLAYQVSIQKKKKMILKINEYQKQNVQQIFKVLTFLIVQLENNQTDIKDKRYYKIIKYHHDKCENVVCKCHQYIKNYQQSDKYYQEKNTVYQILIQIIDKASSLDKKPYYLLILKGFIEYYKLSNSIKAAYIISKVMKQKINIFNQYLISGFLYQISKTFQDTTNMQKYRLFSQYLIKFQKETINLANLYKEFWHQIIEQNSSLVKIINLMKKTKLSKCVIDSSFQALYELFPTNIRITQIYKEVYKEILIDYDAFMKFQSIYKDNIQQKQESKLIRPFNQMNFGPNQDLIVINTSVNVSNDIFHGGCQIISVTNNVYKILGYSSQDLIGKNINRFLPKIYTDFHDEYISNYLNKNDTQIKPRQLIIYPINSNGYLVECAMLNKIMPSLQHGANIVSFLLNSKLSKQNLIIYDQRTGLIDSMSQKAQNLLLGKKTKSNSITIPDHITDILPVWDYVKQQMNEYKKKSAQQSNSAYSNVYLYRSDGPSDNKYVKIVSFELAFQSRIFTMNQCLEENQNFWLGFQTLVQNSPNKQALIKEQKKEQEKQQSQYQPANQSPNPILPHKPAKKQSIIIKNSNNKEIYQSLPQYYPKVYIILQIMILISLVAQILYNYINTNQYYKVLQDDIVIKQNIEDAFALVLQSSHSASQYIFSGNDPLLKNNTNPQTAVADLKQLMGIGKFIYQQIIKKQKKQEMVVSDLIIQVRYFTSPSTTIIKQQTVTDASYQFVLYLIQIYNNLNPLANLANNILFVFKNCINISDEFKNLNEIFTAQLLSNSLKRKSQNLTLIVTILTVFAISLIWLSIYKIVIFLKMQRVIQIYQSIPISQLQKYPKKCENFIKYVSPVQTAKRHVIINTVKSITNLGTALTVNKNRQSGNQMDSLMEEQEEIQYVSFTKNQSVLNIIIESILFLAVFSILFIVSSTSENKLLNTNLEEINDWNSMVRFKGELLQTVYFLNQYKNYGNQWNTTQLIQLSKRFQQSIQSISYYLKSTPRLNRYLSWSYRLVQSSVHIKNNPNTAIEQHLTNQQKVNQLAEQIQNTQIDNTIQKGMQSTILSFVKMLQLILVGELILYLIYSIFYIPRTYKHYLEKKQLIELMYNTLGYKLQNIARNNLSGAE